jgi:hypothetical protein
LIDRRVEQMHNLQLLLLKGSEMETTESRNTFRFDSRYRLGPKNFGVYGGRKVFDWEEIVVSTDSLSFEDYLTSRKYHLISSIFWNDSWFEDAFRVSDQFGIPRSKVFHALLDALEKDQGKPGEFLDSFISETRGELFDSPEQLLEFYSNEQNFERLERGEVGDNLMYKYRALASFFVWPEMCRLATDTFGSLVRDKLSSEEMADFDLFWDDFQTFVKLKHAHGPSIDAIVTPAIATLKHDIPAFIRDGYPLRFAHYRLPAPEPVQFQLSAAGANGLRAAFQVWTVRGLSKMVTRIQIPWQIRSCTPVFTSESRSLAAAG